MMFAAAGQCFCYILITVLVRFNEMPGYLHAQQVASAAVAFFFLYYVFFGIGMQGIPWCKCSNYSVILKHNLTKFSSIPNGNQLSHHANERRSDRRRN